jgi:type VI secretion system protein ImpF
MELSFFDRLSGTQQPSSTSRSRRKIIELICRDLGELLNTRRTEDFDMRYDQAATSLLTFGVVDFTSYNLNSAVEQERVRCSIERAIRQFEPRLARVRVWLDTPDAIHPVLRFQIEAVLRAGDIAEPVVFDARLQRDTRHILISGVE